MKNPDFLSYNDRHESERLKIAEHLKKLNDRPDDFSNVPYLTADRVAIDFFPNSFHTHGLSHSSNPEPPERTEGDIKSFSKKSRIRLLKLFSKLHIDDYGTILFTTLTYHEDWNAGTGDHIIEFANFLKRLRRNFNDLSYVWRIEEQERGAPHYHIFLLIKEKFSGSELEGIKMFIRNSWLKIKKCSCMYCCEHAVKTYEMNSYRRIIYYCSKYTAKISDITTESLDKRRWGKSDNLNQSLTRSLIFSQRAFNTFLEIISSCTEDGKTNEYLKSKIGYADEDFFCFYNYSHIMSTLDDHLDIFSFSKLGEFTLIDLTDP